MSELAGKVTEVTSPPRLGVAALSGLVLALQSPKALSLQEVGISSTRKVVPLRVAFRLRPVDLLIADNNRECHGTVEGIRDDRISLVAYLRVLAVLSVIACEHVSFLGDLNRQIAEPPEGAKVSFRVAPKQ